MKIPRIILAGTSSGVGKTSITCAVIYALKKRGYSVQPFKTGPDYIDPSYLSSISEQNAYNLDAWLMGEEHMLESFARNSTSDISVIEGVMGYYDGFAGDTDYASTYHTSDITKTPVILIIDAARTARSVAAIATGFASFHKDSRIVGVIVNRLASNRHADMCKLALESSGFTVLGCIPRDATLSLKSRHLGLASTLDSHTLYERITKISRTISEYLDIDRIVSLAHTASTLNAPDTPRHSHTDSKVSIGVALDASFNFYYKGNLDALRYNGAELKFFSPITDDVPPDCNGLYLGGGFPEILGERLAKNHSMLTCIKSMSDDSLPIYAECGGLMYLTKQITSDQKCYKMTGVFDAQTEMTKQLTLRYTKGDMSSGTIISSDACEFHGHEFHYSTITASSDAKFAYTMSIGHGIDGKHDGITQHDTLASYGHIYFDSSDYAKTFVDTCARHART